MRANLGAGSGTFETIYMKADTRYFAMVCNNRRCGHRAEFTVLQWDSPPCLTAHKVGLENIVLNMLLSFPVLAIQGKKNC